jgi:hypothetical protein
MELVPDLLELWDLYARAPNLAHSAFLFYRLDEVLGELRMLMRPDDAGQPR